LSLIVIIVPSSKLESCCYKRVHQPATKIHEPTKTNPCKEKKKEHTRLKTRYFSEVGTEEMLLPNNDPVKSSHRSVRNTRGKKTQIDGREERKEAKNAFDIIL
jgi:hypothetical protein